MKKIIIYSTYDKIISLNLVNEIISNDLFKNYKIDIFLAKPSISRKIKILLVMIFFGSLKDFYKYFNQKISIKKILLKNKNCTLIQKVEDDYEFGLSVYCSSKIKLQKYKIYNFHLGSLFNQRGSFIFFYKFIKNWNKISLTFHEIGERFDVGKIVNEREILLEEDSFATDIFFLYLNNLDFLMESIKKINTSEKKEYKQFEKLNVVPSYYRLFKEIIKFYFYRKKID